MHGLTSWPGCIRRSAPSRPQPHTTTGATLARGIGLRETVGGAGNTRRICVLLTVLHGVVFGQVLEVAGLHALQVFYLSSISIQSLVDIYAMQRTRACRIFMVGRCGEGCGREQVKQEAPSSCIMARARARSTHCGGMRCRVTNELLRAKRALWKPHI